ncbi:MAG: cellulase family glycosylhydrolase [Opitutaceae bacterium]|nr:cellulase family glycosylhydrolase [Opitutaceae bacterium]
MSNPINRRQFLQSTTAAGIGLGVAGAALFGRPATTGSTRNALPRWRGFNLLDFFGPDPQQSRPGTTEDHLRWIADWGFDFVRLPMAYPYYLDIDRSKPVTPRSVRRIDPRRVDEVDRLVSLAHKHGLHVSLNLHRAPGYCVNAGFHEPFNLWRDPEALDAFCFHWSMWAQRYAQVSPERLSFDLVNEPSMREDMNDQHSRRSSVPGAAYRRVAQAAAAAIRAANPARLIIADGNDTGTTVIPELADLGIAQSCRGYHPGIVSHYRAPWAFKDTASLPEPRWPGTVEYHEADPVTGKTTVRTEKLGREMLEEAYRPWIALKEQGVGVHCGECGCWNQTPHTVFLAWFGDVLDILTAQGIGYALWEFAGDFGILNSGRADVAYEDWHGHKLDRQLLELLKKY